MLDMGKIARGFRVRIEERLKKESSYDYVISQVFIEDGCPAFTITDLARENQFTFKFIGCDVDAGELYLGIRAEEESIVVDNIRLNIVRRKDDWLCVFNGKSIELLEPETRLNLFKIVNKIFDDDSKVVIKLDNSVYTFNGSNKVKRQVKVERVIVSIA